MFEKVNKWHPDKVADRIAGAIVDYAYAVAENPHIAVEVLIGHGHGHGMAIIETDVDEKSLDHIAEHTESLFGVKLDQVIFVPQDKHLNDNQRDGIRCGDNGIFRGCPTTDAQKRLTYLARQFDTDGKYIIVPDVGEDELIICQSGVRDTAIHQELNKLERLTGREVAWTINPLGEWTGGLDVDTGATNRKLGSDMGDAVTGGGLHGKDLSKADVSVNIYLHLMAEARGNTVEAYCAIGDEEIEITDTETREKITVPYSEIVSTAKKYVNSIGGFEALAEWGLIR